MNQIAHEQIQQVDLASDLREGRFRLAEEESARQMQRHISRDRLEDPGTTLDSVTVGLGTDCGVVTSEDLLAFDALGVDIKDILHKTAADSEIEEGSVFATAEVDEEKLSIHRFGEGIHVKLEIEGQNPSARDRVGSKKIKEKIKDRFASSPGHIQLASLKQGLEGTPKEISTEWFNPREDELGSLVFLQDIQLSSSIRVANQLRDGQSISEIINQQLDSIPDYLATTQQTETETIYTWGEELKQYLIVDKISGNWRYALRSNPEEKYLEEANQSSAKEIPFIDTECAKQMLDWMSEEGIMFAPSMQREIMRVGQADRYGSIYTQISREIAKWVNRPERSTTNLFVAMDEEFHGTKLLDKDPRAYENIVREKGYENQEKVIESLRNIDLDRFDPAARTIMSLVKQSLTRESLDSQLPVTKENISITDGACFDVLVYYMASADGPKGDIYNIEVDGVPMLEKKHGRHTFMLLEETMFNGVKLPKGSLMARASDSGWAFLRLTPLSLDSEEDQKAAGSEIAKVLHNEQKLVARIGGFSLAAMQRRIDDRRIAGKMAGW